MVFVGLVDVDQYVVVFCIGGECVVFGCGLGVCGGFGIDVVVVGQVYFVVVGLFDFVFMGVGGCVGFVIEVFGGGGVEIVVRIDVVGDWQDGYLVFLFLVVGIGQEGMFEFVDFWVVVMLVGVVFFDWVDLDQVEWC